MKNREYYRNRNAYSELWKKVSTTADEDVATETPIVSKPVQEAATEEPKEKPVQTEEAEPSSAQANAISLSNRIVTILEKKAELHNAKHESKVTVDQLKEVYTSGSEDYVQIDESVVDGWKNKLAIKCDWPVFAMARVNSFLRMKRGEKVDLTKNIAKAFASDEELDIASLLLPSEDSLVEANEDLGEIALEDTTLSPQDLYLETQKQAEETSSKNFMMI